MTQDYQPSLLSDADRRAADLSSVYNHRAQTALSLAELEGWKRRVADYQQRLRSGLGESQGRLFDEVDRLSLVDSIDPFTLPPRNAEFWREHSPGAGVPALYFVVDHAVPLLLYVGETVKSNQRWRGVHDCKGYILSYVEAHRQHQLAVTVNIGFWPHADQDRRSRQALESALIRHWRSPFNKENWNLWHTPFVANKP
ncbi:MAG: GIY-YIG nuclease family protein [Cyanobacteriota bacterium]|nr:GIY-YIG nuclease family protein [Cyanobacteriota bacterium]